MDSNQNRSNLVEVVSIYAPEKTLDSNLPKPHSTHLTILKEVLADVPPGTIGVDKTALHML